MRGKFVILNYQQGYAPGINIKYDFNRQNNYNCSTTWALYNKWLDVKNQFINANNRPNTTPYINYLSASGGGFPYFFASGHVTPSTWSDFLWTGVLSNQSNYDPYFPRFGIGIYFEGTNILATNYLNNHNLQYVGFVPADFPGAGLISGIINVNKQFFVNGTQVENGKTYRLQDDQIATGWYYQNGNEYYINPQTGESEKGFQTINGLQYYFNPNSGVEETGVFNTPNGLEYFGGNPSENQSFGQALFYNGWLTLNGKKYYFNSYSKADTSWLTLNGQDYYFNPTTGVEETGLQTINGQNYYFNPQTGSMEKGLQTINGLQFYFNPNSGVQETGVFNTPNGLEYFGGNSSKNQVYGQAIFYSGLLNVNGKKYYFSPFSKAETGWQNVNGGEYYFNPQTGAAEKGFQTINGLQFYFNPNSGVQETGVFNTPNGPEYFGGIESKNQSFGQAIFYSGWLNLNGKKYYFDPFSKAETGWQNVNGGEYYFNPQTGAAEKGFQTINGLQFYFNPNSDVQETGVFNTPNGLEYFGGIESKNQSFGQALFYNGWLNLNGKKYYFNSFSKADTGWLTLNGQKYYFNPQTGVLTITMS